MRKRLSFLALSAAAFVLAAVGLSRDSRSAPSPEALEEILPKARVWIEEERRRHRGDARPLNGEELLRLGPFFPSEVLEEARVKLVPGLANPSFLKDLGTDSEGRLLFDVTSASGIALVDTVLAVESRVTPGSQRWFGLLFHELVHLTQYRELGTEEFVRTYVESLVEVDFRYLAIAHEAQAFALQRRFAAGPEEVFSVRAEVRAAFPAAPASP